MSASPASARVTVLGATGSIGRQALEVIAHHRDRLMAVGLSAGADLEGLIALARTVRPEALALERSTDESAARAALRAAAPQAEVRVGAGSAEWLAASSGAAVIVNGIVGSAGLGASLAALGTGARLALANKESLVVGGALVRRALQVGGELVPVDSEHSAALQCLCGRPPVEVERLVITASGGALRAHPDWRRASRSEVLAHPVWKMGPRITVDSATLFNKGLELIEARWLFDLDWPKLQAVLHPQARIHAMAIFRDGSSVVQAASPDMRLPIQLALSWPEHWIGEVAPLTPERLAGLEFAPIPDGRFPCFDLARQAGEAGGTLPCALNAADEVAVAAFLDGALSLGQVPECIARVLDQHLREEVESLEQLRSVDRRAREAARAAVPA
ncbi:MAG TPA: 1-deoxy-D-xylulose-5-phosphate reductoisomerase [Candidatus Sulfotelmatobacter sp.]|nr:1-deoxy-D-xylulose-5-phosphate reductoisomerase [Candidatus Sulfotelmatobacter sp.]